MVSLSSIDNSNRGSPNLSHNSEFMIDSENTAGSFYSALSEQEEQQDQQQEQEHQPRDDSNVTGSATEILGDESQQQVLLRSDTIKQVTGNTTVESKLEKSIITLKRRSHVVQKADLNASVEVGSSTKSPGDQKRQRVEGGSRTTSHTENKAPVSFDSNKTSDKSSSTTHESNESPTSVYQSDDSDPNRGGVPYNEYIFCDPNQQNNSTTSLKIIKISEETAPLNLKKSTKLEIDQDVIESKSSAINFKDSSENPNSKSFSKIDVLPPSQDSTSDLSSLQSSSDYSIEDITVVRSFNSIADTHIAEIAKKPTESARLSKPSNTPEKEENSSGTGVSINDSSLSNYSDFPLLKLVEASPKASVAFSDLYESLYSSRNSKDKIFGTAQIIYSVPKINKDEYIEEELKSAFASGKNTTKLVEINPFEVIYDDTFQSTSGKPRLANDTFYDKLYHDKIGIQPGTQYTQVLNKGHRRIASDSAPIVTIIDEQPHLRRNGSILSRGASLRHRGSIKSRAKMVSKNELESPKSKDVLDKDGTTRKLKKFFFPVERKRSLKYSKLGQSKPKFENHDELQAYLYESNYLTSIPDLLPQKMSFYSYTRLINVNPHIHKETMKVTIDQNNVFSIDGPNKKFDISLPIEGTVTRNGMQLTSDNLYDYTYNRYKNAVFNQHTSSAPRFETLFPNDTKLLTKDEIENLNKSLLLEVLMRRSLAAKISYRLSRNGIYMNNNRTTKSFTNSYPLKNNFSGNLQDKIEELPPLMKDYGSSDDGDEELNLINYKHLLNQNASFLLDLSSSEQSDRHSFKDKPNNGSRNLSENRLNEHNASLLHLNEFNAIRKHKVRNLNGPLSSGHHAKPVRQESTGSTASSGLKDGKVSLQDSSTDKSNIKIFNSPLTKKSRPSSLDTSVLLASVHSYSGKEYSIRKSL